MKHDLFISYSHVDAASARTVCDSLEEEGLRCWIAPRDITPGADWAEQIIDAMNGVRVMLFVFSASSNASQQVKREIERAVHKNLVVIPLRIDNVLPSKSLEYFLSSQHWFDAFSAPLGTYMEALAHHVRAILHHDDEGGAALALPMPARPALSATPAYATSPAPNHTPNYVPNHVPNHAHATSPTSAIAIAIAIAPEALKFAETALADYIGPVAGILVKRAAGKAARFADLADLLAAELDSESDGERFIETCRRYAREHPF